MLQLLKLMFHVGYYLSASMYDDNNIDNYYNTAYHKIDGNSQKRVYNYVSLC